MANTKNVSEMLNFLNSCALTSFLKLSDLTPNVKFVIQSMRSIRTQFGPAILVKIVGEDQEVILPKRFNKLIEREMDLNKMYKNETFTMEIFPPDTIRKFYDIKFSLNCKLQK